MYVKIHDKPSGIPPADVQVTSAEEADALAWIVLRVRWIDPWSVPHIAATLRLTPSEARDLAERLIKAANETEPK